MKIGGFEVTFTTREDGQVDARLTPQWIQFNEALADSISSLPPRRSPDKGPSTYWIDLAEKRALRAAESHDESPFTWGNITLLRLRSGNVVAAFDFASEDQAVEEVPLQDFLAILAEWRRRVIAASVQSDKPLPETYRRNPLEP